MQLSVIILNYNVCYFLEQTLRSVLRALKEIDSEIIVIDNASTDGSCQMVKQKFPSVKLIENNENVGFSKANNQGVKIAQGTYVCILNPDTAVAEHTFTDCLAFFKKTPNAGIVGVQYIDGTGNFLPECKRNVPTPLRSFLKIIGITRGKFSYYAQHLAPNENGEVEIMAGAFMFLERELYLKVKGFDEAYFMYGEDIDLCYKIIKAGYTNYYLGNQLMLHYKGESTQKDIIYYNRFYGAMKIFYNKHFNHSFILKPLVFAGINITKKLKMGKKNTPLNEKIPVDEVLVVTQDLQLLRNLSNQFTLPFKSIGKRNLEDTIYHHKMFVFDANYLPYYYIFNYMQQHKNKNNIFRILSPKSNFLIGSDYSDQKGEVMLIAE